MTYRLHTHYGQLDRPGDGEQPAPERIVRDRDAEPLDEPQLGLLHPYVRQRMRLSEPETYAKYSGEETGHTLQARSLSA